MVEPAKNCVYMACDMLLTFLQCTEDKDGWQTRAIRSHRNSIYLRQIMEEDMINIIEMPCMLTLSLFYFFLLFPQRQADLRGALQN